MDTSKHSKKRAVDEEKIHELVSKRYSKDIYKDDKEQLTFGQMLADKVASFAGSWSFIIIFATSLIIWIVINTWVLAVKPFDPYPYILLNLILSCIAATQAPVIMMSQNRQESKDRLRAENEYEINLKSEHIVEDLHYKIDKILENQEIYLKRCGELEKEIEQLKRKE